MNPKRLRAALAVSLLVLAGCGASSDGPSAPSPAPANDPARAQPKTLPLKQVGAPIG